MNNGYCWYTRRFAPNLAVTFSGLYIAIFPFCVATRRSRPRPLLPECLLIAFYFPLPLAGLREGPGAHCERGDQGGDGRQDGLRAGGHGGAHAEQRAADAAGMSYLWLSDGPLMQQVNVQLPGAFAAVGYCRTTFAAARCSPRDCFCFTLPSRSVSARHSHPPQLAKLVAVNKPDLVLMVAEALVGSDGVDQLTSFDRALVDYAGL